MRYVPVTHKFVAIVNKKVPVGNAMNAIGHMAAGLVALTGSPAEMRFGIYRNKDGGEHKSISDNPFIVLRADNSNQIRTVRQTFLGAHIPFTDFTNTMIEGTYLDQQERTAQTPEAELEYYGVCMFGEIDTLNGLTKKFSLWRG